MSPRDPFSALYYGIASYARCVHLLMRRFDDLLAEFEVALSLNPNFSLTQSVYAFALALCGDWEKADEAARRALRLSPRDPFSAPYYGIASYAQFVGRNYDETMRLARTSIRLREDHAPGHRMLTAAAAMAGEAEVATAALQIEVQSAATRGPRRRPTKRPAARCA